MNVHIKNNGNRLRNWGYTYSQENLDETSLFRTLYSLNRLTDSNEFGTKKYTQKSTC